MAIEIVEKAEGEEALLVADEFLDWWQQSDDAFFDWPDDEGEDEYDEEPEPPMLIEDTPGNWTMVAYGLSLI